MPLVKTETLRIRNVVDATRLGAWFAIRGGYRMARGWHFANISSSSALRLSFSGMCTLLLLFLPHCCFCFCFCFSFALVGAL